MTIAIAQLDATEDDRRPMTPGPPLTQQCSSCTRRAIFATPYGRLCLQHTLKEMKSDADLWMPQTIDDHIRRRRVEHQT